MGRDRRRYARAGVALDFSVRAEERQWQGKTIDLSPYGVKIELPPQSMTLSPGWQVELRLDLPGGSSSLSLKGRVARTATDGIALSFVDLPALAFARLKELVDALLESLAKGSADLAVQVGPPQDRRRAPRIAAELDVQLSAGSAGKWATKTIDLSTLGMKVTWPAAAGQASWGTPVRLRLAGPDGHAALSLKGVVWRREPQSRALLLIEFTPAQRQHLKVLVDSLRP